MQVLQRAYRWAELNFYGLAVSSLFSADAAITATNIASRGTAWTDISHLVVDVIGLGLSTGMFKRQAERYEKLQKRLAHTSAETLSPTLYEPYLFSPCTRRALRIALRDSVDERVWGERFRPEYPVSCAFQHFSECLPQTK